MKKHFLTKAILILAILAIILDGGFTLWGQSKYYWQDYYRVNETNPLAHYLLATHPGLFMLGGLIYLLLCLALVYFLKSPFNLMVGLTLFLWHSLGSSSWVKTIVLKFYKNLPWTDYVYWYLPLVYLTILGIVSGLIVYKLARK